MISTLVYRIFYQTGWSLISFYFPSLLDKCQKARSAKSETRSLDILKIEYRSSPKASKGSCTPKVKYLSKGFILILVRLAVCLWFAVIEQGAPFPTHLLWPFPQRSLWEVPLMSPKGSTKKQIQPLRVLAAQCPGWNDIGALHVDRNSRKNEVIWHELEIS